MTYSPKWNLKSIPDDALRSEWCRRASLRRQVKNGGHNGGRKPFPRCACGLMTTSMALLRQHVCKGGDTS